MGWLLDMLKDVPTSAVLKERLALADDKYQKVIEENASLKQRVAALERLNGELRAQIPIAPATDLDGDTARVLVHLFRAEDDDRDVGYTANALRMERSVLQYHLDRLDERQLAVMTGGNYGSGHVYWALTADGRRYVVERKLI